MIKMRYSELSKVSFLQALGKLANVPMRDPKAFRIKHIITGIQKHKDAMGDAFKKDIMAVFASGGVDSKDPPAGRSAELGLPFLALEGKEDAAKAALEDFGKREVTVDQPKLSGDFIISVAEWSVAELSALEPIMVDIVEVS